MRVVNLSRRPFVNDRPVVRLAALLWVLGGALLVANIYSYTNYWSDSAEVRSELAAIESEVEREQRSFSDLKERFQRLDLETMNQQTAFLNGLIRDRTFPWSALFEDLEDVLPFGVKLGSVHPEVPEDPRSASRRPPERRSTSRSRSSEPPPPSPPPPPPAVEEVVLSLNGHGKTGEDVLDFVDALFGHPAFRQPKLRRESLDESTGMIAFDVTTLYRTKAAQDEAAAIADGGDAEPAAADDPEGIAAGARAAGQRRPVAPAAGGPAAGGPAAGGPAAGAVAGDARSTDPRAGDPRTGDRRAADRRAADRRAADGEPAATITGVAELPSGGIGTPAGGVAPAAAGTVLVGPAVTAPAPPASAEAPATDPRAPARRQPASRARNAPAADEGAPAGSDPRFVEPSASGAARLRRGGSGGSRP